MNRLYTEYEKFKKRIFEVSQYIENTTSKNKTITELINLSDNDEHHAFLNYLKSLTSSTIQYNAIIISLYACYENYIDSLLKEYLNILFENIDKIEEVPTKLYDKYQFKLGEFLSNPHRFPDELNIHLAVQKFYNLLESDFSSGVDKLLILSRPNNLQPTTLFTLMNDLGIKDCEAQILNLDLFKNYYIYTVGMDDNEYDIKKTRKEKGKSNTLFAPLDELVLQRNNVAHSWSGDNRLTTTEITDNVIPFIIVFGECVLRICLTSIFEKIPESKYNFLDKTPINTIKNHILCISSQNTKIQNGDYVLYKSNTKNKCGKIIKIEENGTETLQVRESQNIPIGIELDETVKKNDSICCVVNKSM